MSDPSNNPLPLGEIVQGPSAFEQFLENNQKLVGFIAIATALGIAGFMVFRTVQEDKALDAGAALYSAEDIADLEKVKLEFSGTPSAVTAALSIAEKLWTNGQQDDAISTLQEITAKFPKHPATALAQYSLGHRLLFQGKTNDASNAFQAVIDRDDSEYLAAASAIALGDIAVKAGDSSKATALYTSVTTDHVKTKMSELAADRLKLVSFQAPEEVEAPPVVSDPPPLLRKPEQVGGKNTGNPLLDSLNSPDSSPEPALPDSPETSPNLPE